MPLTRRLLDGILTDATATAGILDPAAVWVFLVTAGPAVTPPATAADFTLPTGTGLGPKAITTWGAIQYLTDGRSARASPALTWVPASSADGFSAIGWALGDSSVGGNILEWDLFATPVALPDVHSPLTLIVRVTTDPAGNWDATVVIDG